MFVCPSICFGIKSCKNGSIVTKFWYVFDVSSLSSCTQNYDNFKHRATSKCFWIFFSAIFHNGLFSLFSPIFINLFLFKRSRFYGDTIVNSVVMQQFAVCLSVYLCEHLFGLKTKWNWSVVTKFTHVYEVNNLILYIKNRNHTLNTSHRVTSKSWMYW